MSQTVRGVISRRKGEPVELVDIVIPEPGPGEVVVDVQACGCAIRTSLIARAASTTPIRSCSGTKRPGLSKPSAKASPGSPRRLRRPQLARGLWPVPGLQAWTTVVLLRHLQCDPEDDAH